MHPVRSNDQTWEEDDQYTARQSSSRPAFPRTNMHTQQPMMQQYQEPIYDQLQQISYGLNSHIDPTFNLNPMQNGHFANEGTPFHQDAPHTGYLTPIGNGYYENMYPAPSIQPFQTGQNSNYLLSAPHGQYENQVPFPQVGPSQERPNNSYLPSFRDGFVEEIISPSHHHPHPMGPSQYHPSSSRNDPLERNYLFPQDQQFQGDFDTHFPYSPRSERTEQTYPWPPIQPFQRGSTSVDLPLPRDNQRNAGGFNTDYGNEQDERNRHR